MEDYDPGIEHVILLQGVDGPLPPKLEALFGKYGGKVSLKLETVKTTLTIGESLDIVHPKTTHPLIWKADDDCMIQSRDFFLHLEEINKMFPDMVFSPFPVGLIQNFGGVPSQDRFVRYSERTGVFYTFRRVRHVGGFARCCPAKYLVGLKFGVNSDEDMFFSNVMGKQKIQMCYLENAIVVEHQESTLGQKERKSLVGGQNI